MRTQNAAQLAFSHNSTVVTASYCAVFALRLLGTSASRASIADVDATTSLVRQLADLLSQASKRRFHEKSVLQNYAEHLANIVRKFEHERDRGPSTANAGTSPPARPGPSSAQGAVLQPSLEGPLLGGSALPGAFAWDAEDTQGTLGSLGEYILIGLSRFLLIMLYHRSLPD